LVPPPETNCLLFVAKEIVFKLGFDSLFPPFSEGMMKWLASQRFPAWQEMEAGSEQWTQRSLDSYCAEVNRTGLPRWNKHCGLIVKTSVSYVSYLSKTIDFRYGIAVNKVTRLMLDGWSSVPGKNSDLHHWPPSRRVMESTQLSCQ